MSSFFQNFFFSPDHSPSYLPRGHGRVVPQQTPNHNKQFQALSCTLNGNGNSAVTATSVKAAWYSASKFSCSPLLSLTWSTRTSICRPSQTGNKAVFHVGPPTLTQPMVPQQVPLLRPWLLTEPQLQPQFVVSLFSSFTFLLFFHLVF